MRAPDAYPSASARGRARARADVRSGRAARPRLASRDRSAEVMSSARAREEFPQMDGKRMKYVSVFYEGAHNDSRTNIAIALTAGMYGACIANYAKVETITFDKDGVACGATVSDQTVRDPKPFAVKAKKVIYAGGPFTDGLRELSEGKDVKPHCYANMLYTHYANVYIYIYIYTCINLSLSIYIYIHRERDVCMYVYVYIYIYAHTYLCLLLGERT